MKRVTTTYRQAKNLGQLQLMLLFLLTFSTFKYFPGMNVINEFRYVIAFLFILFPYALHLRSANFKISSFELYLLGIIFFTPVLSAFAAQLSLGQPIFYGLLVQRAKVLAAGALFLIYLARQNRLNLKVVEKSLITLAWVTMLIYMAMGALFTPEQFDTVAGFTGGMNTGEAEFFFDSTFIILGFFYYAFLNFRKHHLASAILAVLFFLYLVVVDGGRSMLLSVVSSLLILLMRWSSMARLALLIPKLLIAGFIALISFYFFFSEKFLHLMGKFSDAFMVAFMGIESADASANARLFEIDTALPYIREHWLIGNGQLSNQWNGGYEGVIGAYFYPSDIGLVGVLYMFGVVGLVAFAAQFLFLRGALNKLPETFSTPLLDAIKGYMLYYALHSLVTGRFVHLAEVGLTFIAIIYCIAYSYRKSDLRTSVSKEV